MIICANPSEQFKSYQAEIEQAVISVMRGNRYVLGKEVVLLEQEFADYIGTTSAIGVANGTDAIELADFVKIRRNLTQINDLQKNIRRKLRAEIRKKVF